MLWTPRSVIDGDFGTLAELLEQFILLLLGV